MSKIKKYQHSDVPDLLCIGFLCHDLYEGKYLLGGTASYSGIMASHLGMRTAILTSVGSDFGFHNIFAAAGIEIVNKAATRTTVFENIYKNGNRTQYIHHRAETLYPEDLPVHWASVPIVKFCLIADEADFSFLQYFPNALVAATIQGWLRQWNEKGRISPKEMDWKQLRFVDIVFMSEDDIAGFESAIPQIAGLVKILVMTKGGAGAEVYYEGKRFEFPAFQTNEVDPTGAGDIFAVSFLVKYRESESIADAIAFAHAAASLIVEDYGIKIPDLKTINERYRIYRSRFLEGREIK